MLDSIYHVALKLLKTRTFCVKMSILPYFTQCYKERHYVTLLNCKPLVVYRFYCMAFNHSQRRCHVRAQGLFKF